MKFVNPWDPQQETENENTQSSEGQSPSNEVPESNNSNSPSNETSGNFWDTLSDLAEGFVEAIESLGSSRKGDAYAALATNALTTAAVQTTQPPKNYKRYYFANDGSLSYVDPIDGTQNEIYIQSLEVPEGRESRYTFTQVDNFEEYAKFIAIVCGESSNSVDEARAIAHVMLNRMKFKNVTIGNNGIESTGGASSYSAMRSVEDTHGYPRIYNAFLNGTLENQENLTYFGSKIRGAVQAIVGFSDNSDGAYFWEATTATNQWYWKQYNKKIFVITTDVGQTTFFKYNPNKTENPDYYNRVFP